MRRGTTLSDLIFFGANSMRIQRGFVSKLGSLAMLAAIRRASLQLRSLAGENRGKTNGQTDARPFGDIKKAML